MFFLSAIWKQVAEGTIHAGTAQYNPTVLTVTVNTVGDPLSATKFIQSLVKACVA